MILSQSCKIAIRAVLFLSTNSNREQKYGSHEIAKEINVPAPFLAKTFQELAKKNLISSIRGRNGGYYLTDEDNSNTIISIVRCIDRISRFDECILGLPECGDAIPCPVHHLISPMKETLTDGLFSKTIKELAKEVKDGKTHIVI